MEKSLHRLPVVEVVQNGIHPPIHDAVGLVKLPLVVEKMLLRRNYVPSLLKEPDYFVRFGVHHVSPLVTLIGQNPQRHSKHNGPVAGLRKESSTRKHQAGRNEKGHRVGRSSICLHPTVYTNILRVNMVKSEGTDQCSSKDRSLQSTPSISGPVHETRDVVDYKLGDDEAQDGGEGIGVPFHSFLDEEKPKDNADGKIYTLPNEFPEWVAIFRKGVVAIFSFNLFNLFLFFCCHDIIISFNITYRIMHIFIRFSYTTSIRILNRNRSQWGRRKMGWKVFPFGNIIFIEFIL